MGILTKTISKGFRPCIFRNQSVHQFYGHLQAVMQNIDSSGSMGNLFAKPFFPNGEGGGATEIEWMTDLNGDAVKFSELSPMKQQEVAGMLAAYLEKVRKYAEERKGKTGVEKDYADYLQAVAVNPDLNQVFLVQNQPVIVHWGFIPEGGGDHGQGIFAGWEEFISQVQRKAAPEAPPKPKPAPPPPPPVLPPEPKKPEVKVEEKKPVPPPPAQQPVPEKKEQKKQEQKASVFAGLGEYEWVKWLAIILAIVILLLLLLRLLPPPQQSSQGQPGMSSGSGSGSGGGGMPGGGMPGGGSSGGGRPGGGGKSGGGSPGGGNSGGGSPGGGIPSGQGGGPKPGIDVPCPTCGHSKEHEGAGHPTEGKPGSPEIKKPKAGESGISFQEEGNTDHKLISRPKDTKTTWKIVDSAGNPVPSDQAFFQNSPDKTSATGDSVTLSLRPQPGKALECSVVADNGSGETTRYDFITKGK